MADIMEAPMEPAVSSRRKVNIATTDLKVAMSVVTQGKIAVKGPETLMQKKNQNIAELKIAPNWSHL